VQKKWSEKQFAGWKWI